MLSITPNLWFDGDALEAAEFYTSVLPDSEILEVTKAPGDNPSTAAGEVLMVTFRIAGQRVTGINGGPQFPFSEAFSFAIECETQQEADTYWEALVAGGGSHSQCGWLKDRFGFSWQVVPRGIGDYLGGPDPEGAARAMAAMLTMQRLDVEGLRRAYAGDVDAAEGSR